MVITRKNSTNLDKALRNAANQNNVEKLKEILLQGIDANVKDEGQHGRTALHWAVIKQAYPCIKLLLIAGDDVMMIDNAGKSSLDYAGEKFTPDALFFLLSHHYKLPLDIIDSGKLLQRAAHQKMAHHIRLLLKHIKDVNEKDTRNSQRTALHWAVIQEATDCIETLVMAGADPQ